VLRRIREDDALRRVSVVVVSAMDVASAMRCVELGATDYLPKPINPALLKARLGAALAERLLQELEEQLALIDDAAVRLLAGRFEGKRSARSPGGRAPRDRAPPCFIEASLAEARPTAAVAGHSPEGHMQAMTLWDAKTPSASCRPDLREKVPALPPPAVTRAPAGPARAPPRPPPATRSTFRFRAPPSSGDAAGPSALRSRNANKERAPRPCR
jgi:hypothetical protein